MPRWTLASLFALAAAGAVLLDAAPARGADAAALKERREKAMLAVTGDGDVLPRAKAVADLAALDDADAGRALAECVSALGLRQTQLEIVHQQTLKAYEPYSGFTMKEAKDWATKKELSERLEKEEERLQGLGAVAQACVTAMSRMKSAEALAALEKVATTEKEPRSRAVYWGGLIANPATNAAELAKKALKDEAPAVRIAALEAMAARKDPALVEFAAKALTDPGWPARQAAIRVLAAAGDPKAIPPLVAAMQTEEGALLEDFGKALAGLTGQNFGHHPDVWRKWYEENKAALAEKGAKPQATKPGKPLPPPVNYYGLETLSRRVLFVIDISGSMKEEIGGAAEETGVSRKDQPYTGPKIEIAKRVLSEALQKLEPHVTFNIVFFNHQVQTFQDRMVAATPEMKGKAELEVADLQPAGSTYAYGALRTAFEFAGVTGTPVTGKFDPLVDTIFFLSDGAPTEDSLDDPQPMPPEQILSAVREWNKVAHVKIHTIAIDPRIGKGAFVRFMKGLAAENHGTYTEIGSK